MMEIQEAMKKMNKTCSFNCLFPPAFSTWFSAFKLRILLLRLSAPMMRAEGKMEKDQYNLEN